MVGFGVLLGNRIGGERRMVIDGFNFGEDLDGVGMIH